MTYFYVSAIALVAFACVFVVFPILRQEYKLRHGMDTDFSLSNAKVVKQRMTELDQEFKEGLISQSDKALAIRDLKLALVDETPEQQPKHYQVKWLLVLTLAFPAIVVGGWVYWQSNQLAGLKEYSASQLEVAELRKKLEEQGPESLTPNDFAKFALSIRSKLRDDPTDEKAWAYLAMVNTSIGRIEEGIAAYEKALDLSPYNDELRFKFAEALMLQGTEDSLNNAKRQLNYLIQKQGDARNYRLLMTSVAIQLQDVETALTQFSIIKNQMNPSSQFYRAIVNELQKLGVDPSRLVANQPSTDNEAPANTQVISSETEQSESQTQTEGPEQSNTLVKGNTLDIVVNISQALLKNVPEEAFLIVFAQNAQSQSRAPLAVKRMPLPEFPIKIRLSDNDAMIPAMNLSSASLVRVSARISFDQDVMPSEGELEGRINAVTLQNDTVTYVEIEIDSRL